MEKADASSVVEEVKPDTTSTTPTEPTAAKPVEKSSGSIFDDLDSDDAPEAPVSAKATAETTKTESQEEAKATWREDWREALANGDEKRLKELKRYNSMDDWAKAQFGLRTKLSSGEYIRKPPANASDEEKAKWREEIGVPKEWGEYELPEVEGYEWTEQDAPMVQSFLEAMHAADTPQPIAQKALEWYGNLVAAQQEQMHQMDLQAKQEVEDQLREEWGNEYRPTLNLIGRYLKDGEVFPDGFAKALNEARLPDGRRLVNQAAFANWLGSLARERYGEGAMLYGDARANVTNRKSEIEKILQSDPRRYWAEGLDVEYQDLLRKIEAADSKRR